MNEIKSWIIKTIYLNINSFLINFIVEDVPIYFRSVED